MHKKETVLYRLNFSIKQFLSEYPQENLEQSFETKSSFL